MSAIPQTVHEAHIAIERERQARRESLDAIKREKTLRMQQEVNILSNSEIPEDPITAGRKRSVSDIRAKFNGNSVILNPMKSSDSHMNDTNKGIADEISKSPDIHTVHIEKQESVADIRRRFTGTSLVETQEAFYRKLMARRGMSGSDNNGTRWQRRSSSIDNEKGNNREDALTGLTEAEKQSFLQGWAYSEQEGGAECASDAEEFLSTLGVRESVLDEQEWREWKQAIRNTQEMSIQKSPNGKGEATSNDVASRTRDGILPPDSEVSDPTYDDVEQNEITKSVDEALVSQPELDNVSNVKEEATSISHENIASEPHISDAQSSGGVDKLDTDADGEPSSTSPEDSANISQPEQDNVTTHSAAAVASSESHISDAQSSGGVDKLDTDADGEPSTSPEDSANISQPEQDNVTTHSAAAVASSEPHISDAQSSGGVDKLDTDADGEPSSTSPEDSANISQPEQDNVPTHSAAAVASSEPHISDAQSRVSYGSKEPTPYSPDNCYRGGELKSIDMLRESSLEYSRCTFDETGIGASPLHSEIIDAPTVGHSETPVSESVESSPERVTNDSSKSCCPCVIC